MVQFLLTLRGCLGDPKELGEAAERPKPIRCPVSRYRVFDRRILGYDDRGRRWRGLCFAGAPCLRILRDRPWVRSRHPSRRGATIALLLLPLSALMLVKVSSPGLGHVCLKEKNLVLQVVRHLIAAGHDVHVVTGAPEFVFTTEIQSPNLHIRKVGLDTEEVLGKPFHQGSDGSSGHAGFVGLWCCAS
ncbi:hypothetical protein BHM03_00019885 [Ensete ventricosum]|nr:hypothetical protein BHM03_00019885 [Ensete ventricosum]